MALCQQILKEEYQFVRAVHRSKKSELILYRHRILQKHLLVLKTKEALDLTVYERLKAIRHPNLMQIYDIVQEGDIPLIFEEYIDGMTLEGAGIMKSLGVKRVLRQLCDGVEALHSIGIIHRDLTLQNVMLDRTGTVKIIDFNISKAFRKRDDGESTLGTVSFAPPEQFGITQTDERSDIFAIGILANLLLTGEHPSKQLYRPKSSLGRMIQKATSLNMDSRYRSAAELRRIL